VSSAGFPDLGKPADVTDVLGRYRTRTYANGYQLTYEYAVAVEDEVAGLRVEHRQVAVEAVDGDAVPVAGVPEWVVTRSADPDGQPGSEHAQRHEALAAYRAALAAQAVE
jgi:hypothetical protein